MGNLKALLPQGEPLQTPRLQLPARRQQRPPLRPQGRLKKRRLLRKIWEVGNVDSPVRAADDELLDEPSNQEDSQAQEAGDTPRETPEEADPNTTPTGGETPSTGVTAGLSELSVSSPRAQPTPEPAEGPTNLHSSRSCQRHRPTHGRVERSRLDHTRRL